MRSIYAALLKDGAVPRVVSSKLGKVSSISGDALDVEISLEAGPSVLYDAVIVAALSALAADGTSGDAIAGKLQEVSGGSGAGEKATTFEDAASIILSGEVVDYDGPSGPIDFDDNGDAASAVIGIYTYGADNTFARITRAG